MSEASVPFTPADVVKEAEAKSETSYPVAIGLNTAFYFLRALNDTKTLRIVEESARPEIADVIEKSQAHALFVRLTAARDEVELHGAAIVQFPLTQSEYEVVRDLGQLGKGHIENNTGAEAKRNIRALDQAFKQAKKRAGVPGPIRSVVNRIIPKRFQK